LIYDFSSSRKGGIIIDIKKNAENGSLITGDLFTIILIIAFTLSQKRIA